MKQSALSQRIEFLLSATHPVAVGCGDIVDLSSFSCVYSDGQFSDSKEEWYWCHDSNNLVRRTWSLWQGSTDDYVVKSIADYMKIMPTDATHFDRWVSGLREIVVQEK